MKQWCQGLAVFCIQLVFLHNVKRLRYVCKCLNDCSLNLGRCNNSCVAPGSEYKHDKKLADKLGAVLAIPWQGEMAKSWHEEIDKDMKIGVVVSLNDVSSLSDSIQDDSDEI